MDAELQPQGMDVVGEGLEACAVDGRGEAVGCGNVTSILVEDEDRAGGAAGGRGIAHEPFHVEDGIVPAAAREMAAHPPRVGAELRLRDRSAVGVVAVPAHRRRGGRDRRRRGRRQAGERGAGSKQGGREIASTRCPHPVTPGYKGRTAKFFAAARARRLRSGSRKASALISNTSPGSTRTCSENDRVAVPKKCTCTSPGRRKLPYLKW